MLSDIAESSFVRYKLAEVFMYKQKRKKTASAAASKQQNGLALKVIKGAVLGLLITVAAVLILAFIVKSTDMSDETISAFNQAIKIASIFVAALAASKGVSEKFMAHGALSGGLYVLLGYLTFSLIEGAFGDILLMFMDLAMGIAIGMITAFIFGKLLGSKKETTTKGSKKAY